MDNLSFVHADYEPTVKELALFASADESFLDEQDIEAWSERFESSYIYDGSEDED